MVLIDPPLIINRSYISHGNSGRPEEDISSARSAPPVHQERHEDEDPLRNQLMDFSIRYSLRKWQYGNGTNLNDLHDGTKGANVAGVEAAAAHLARLGGGSIRLTKKRLRACFPVCPWVRVRIGLWLPRQPPKRPQSLPRTNFMHVSSS